MEQKMKARPERLSLLQYLLLTAALLAAMCLCVCLGSVNIPLWETLDVLGAALKQGAAPEGVSAPILLRVRLPRVLCVALSGAGLSLAGACMQGLLRNPLADGSTLGVSSGAALGAVIAIAFGLNFPALPFAGTTVMAVLFAFGSLLVILGLSYKLDRSLSTNTIILIGVIYSMFVSSAMSVLVTFASDKLKSITFWTMGSFQGSTYGNAALLAAALAVCGTILCLHARELNAFAIGEDNARNIGVNVRRAKLTVLVAVSVLIGVCAHGADALRPESQTAASGIDALRRDVPAAGGPRGADGAAATGAAHRRGHEPDRRDRVHLHFLSDGEGALRCWRFGSLPCGTERLPSWTDSASASGRANG